jgi:hypothetical protein
MKLMFCILLNVLFVSIANAQLLDINLSFDDHIYDTTFAIKLAVKHQNYIVSVHIAEEDSSSIVFYRKINPDGKLVNDTLNIIPLHPDYVWRVGKTFTLFDFKDINLDGYDDLFVLYGVDDHYWLPSYEIWLYNRNEGKYFHSDDFSEKVYSDYVLDKKYKTITSSWTGYNDHNENGSLTYKIEGDKLNLIEEIRLSSEGLNKYVWTHKKLVNGNLVVVKQITKTLEQVDRGE